LNYLAWFVSHYTFGFRHAAIHVPGRFQQGKDLGVRISGPRMKAGAQNLLGGLMNQNTPDSRIGKSVTGAKAGIVEGLRQKSLVVFGECAG
jgi:hypothetical protein